KSFEYQRAIVIVMDKEGNFIAGYAINTLDWQQNRWSLDSFIDAVSTDNLIFFTGDIWDEVVGVDELAGRSRRITVNIRDVTPDITRLEYDFRFSNISGEVVELTGSTSYAGNSDILFTILRKREGPKTAEVKVRGYIISDPEHVVWPSGNLWQFDIKIAEVLSDPTGSLHVGDQVFVEVHLHKGAQLIDFPETGPEKGDHVEVYGRYFGELWAEEEGHYAKKIEGELVNVGIVFVRTNGHDTSDVITDIGKWRKILDDVSRYYLRQSRGTLLMQFRLYPIDNNEKGGGEEISAYNFGWNYLFHPGRSQLAKDLVRFIDSDVDFKEFDYTRDFGRGIIVFIILDRHDALRDWDGDVVGIFCGGSPVPLIPECESVYLDGGAFHADETAFDVIIIDDGLSWDKLTRFILAHELGHWLGDLFESSEWSPSFKLAPSLPDLPDARYELMDNDDFSDVHMGIRSLSSITRFWLGWISYVDYEREQFLNSPLTIRALSELRIGDTHPRILMGKDEWVVIDYRARIDLPTTDALVAYKVKKVCFIRRCELEVSTLDNQTSVSKGTVLRLDEYNLKVEVLKIEKDKQVEVKIEKAGRRNLSGISIYVASSAAPIAQEGITLEPYIDIDLHAYTIDGRHVGVNYQTGEYENEILGSVSSGDNLHSEWILVPTDFQVVFIVKLKVQHSIPYQNLTLALEAIKLDENGERFTSELLVLNASQSDMERGIRASTTIDLTVEILLIGDINGDGFVDYKDLAVLGASYGRHEDEPMFNPLADLNGDSVVDYKDLAILGANYGKRR
ncbi:hypothetical protein DRO64_07315, partial [Candidatus Bathyarchaeota archaeon]